MNLMTRIEICRYESYFIKTECISKLHVLNIQTIYFIIRYRTQYYEGIYKLNFTLNHLILQYLLHALQVHVP